MFVTFSLALCTLTLLSSGLLLSLLTTVIALLSAVSLGDSSMLRQADNYKWRKKIDLIVLPFVCQNRKNCSQIRLWLLVTDSLSGIKSSLARLWRAPWSLPLAFPPLLSRSVWLNNVSRARGHFLSSKTTPRVSLSSEEWNEIRLGDDGCVCCWQTHTHTHTHTLCLWPLASYDLLTVDRYE